jgi:hypothetical protein
LSFAVMAADFSDDAGPVGFDTARFVTAGGDLHGIGSSPRYVVLGSRAFRREDFLTPCVGSFGGLDRFWPFDRYDIGDTD